MTDLLLKLLLAHLIGDFLIQPGSWVKSKEQKKHKSPHLYLHILIHLLALLIVLGFDSSYWTIYLTIPLSHLIIDALKLNLQKSSVSKTAFFLDQIAHLIVIALLVNVYYPYSLSLEVIGSTPFIGFLIALIMLTHVSAVLMRIIMSQWKLAEDDGSHSLRNAGQYIGILERLFVFTFILLNQWSAIGLLIAAKSVLRFSDLSRSKDRKLTEYILIGTLLSFGLAILIALGYQQVMIRLGS
ncbi:DUF3307 domain-containing protein [Reichenbachiella ulvae]|uniref:DUF3307 domain-containing protein n=1 Tax=Reichenbachiella ulvae TaxID=2980104 RepID=A0ABT3CSD4_9BACT|nr:DUF3307 domain-containing protein [Reichenbachiella ulvae]MCV9386419.1 DUF3307 domain-containing protein [Reichenbachiella ulvae]